MFSVFMIVGIAAPLSSVDKEASGQYRSSAADTAQIILACGCLLYFHFTCVTAEAIAIAMLYWYSRIYLFSPLLLGHQPRPDRLWFVVLVC